MTTIINTREALTAFRQSLGNKRLGFVPTMGNLHEGHLSLIRIAQNDSDATIVSIFVNPTQFGQNEDLDAYPRTFDADLAQLEALGVDAVFYPDEATIYPNSKANTLIIAPPPELTHILCGVHRPTHFHGVATVVAKLFQLVKPDVAVFGEKDFQQLAIVKRLSEELFFDVQVLSGAIVREADGLAMSSRNQYLNAEERQRAVWLSKTLHDCRKRLLANEPINAVLAQGKLTLAQHGIGVDYLDYRDKQTLTPEPSDITQGILLVAGKIGQTRLIDNLAMF